MLKKLNHEKEHFPAVLILNFWVGSGGVIVLNINYE